MASALVCAFEMGIATVEEVLQNELIVMAHRVAMAYDFDTADTFVVVELIIVAYVEIIAVAGLTLGLAVN